MAFRSGLSKLVPSLWPILGLLPSLVLVGVAAVYAVSQPYDGLNWSTTTGKIREVDPRGPAAHSGLDTGDVILAVDGTPLVQLSALYTGKRAGDPVAYRVLPGDKSDPVEVQLELASPSSGLVLSRLTSVLIAMSLWFISVTVLILRPGSAPARLFFLVNQVGSIGLSAGLLSTFGLETGARLFHLALSWLSPLVVHFHTLFPAPRRTPIRYALLRLLYVISLVLSIPFLVSWSWLRTGLILNYSDLYVMVRMYFLLGLVGGLLLLARNYWVMPSQVARQRIRLVAFSSVVAFAPLALFSILPEILWGQPLMAYEISFLSLLLIPLSYGYALYRYNLFETDRVLNRSLVYVVLVLFWVGLYLALVTVIQRFLSGPVPANALGGALLILAMVLAFPILRTAIQRIVDRVFYGGWYDYQTVVTRFSHALGVTLEEATLVDLLIEQLPKVIRVRRTGLLLPGPDRILRPYCTRSAATGSGQACACFACELTPSATLSGWNSTAQVDQDTAVGVEVRPEGALTRSLQRWSGPVESDQLRRQFAGQSGESGQMLSPGEWTLLHHPEIQLWLPLVFQAELEGILLLGSKLADDLYRDEDYRILDTLAYQTAATIRNVRLVKELRQRLEDISLSRYELQEAHGRLLTGREEERKRLARDIHDGPLQKLIEISYHLRDSRRTTKDSSLQDHLQDLHRTTLRLLDELRRICSDLRPPALDILGLSAAMRTYSEEIYTDSEIVLDIHGDDKLLPTDVSISLYRIFQETLANVLRHSRATRIEVKLEISCDACHLAVRDDGQGFNVPVRLEGLASRKHYGLLGMRERAKALSGTLEIVSAPGLGTWVKVWVPLTSAPPSEAEPPK